MRILQLVFSIWGLFACRDFSITFDMDCNDKTFHRRYEIEYPFEFGESICRRKVNNQTLFFLSVDSSTGAQFFVITAVLSLLYAAFIIFVYAYLDEMYKSKPEFPMAVSRCTHKKFPPWRELFLGLCVDWHPGILLAGRNIRIQQRRQCFEKDIRWRLH